MTTNPHPTASGKRDVIVVGAGPVGLATALLLARQGRRVTVYEGQTDWALSDDNSYPIGLNPRGQATLKAIDPALLEQVRARGEVVEGFHIRAGERTVAQLPSGTLIATTRARLTEILLRAAFGAPGVRLVSGHRLTGLDVDARTLGFDTTTGPVTVDAADALVVCCDGVWSAARGALAAQRPDFAPQMGDWGVKFRVLFSQPGADAPRLDPAWHHIFTSKGIYTATLPSGVWCVAVTAIDGDPAADLLLSTQATDAHVEALRAHLATHAPYTTDLFTDADYRAFFARKPFGGAVVRCPRVHDGEWLALLGDAAHSVIPPTGEGVNSGLEDALVLAHHLGSESATPLADYNAERMPDLRALGDYAWYLKDNIASDDPGRAFTNVGIRIAAAACGRFGRRDGLVEERLFGPHASTTPYRSAIGPWLSFRDRWTRILAPAAAVVRVLAPLARRRRR